MNSLWESNLLMQLAAVFIFAIRKVDYLYKNAINSASPISSERRESCFFSSGRSELCFFSSEVFNCVSLRQVPWTVRFFVRGVDLISCYPNQSVSKSSHREYMYVGAPYPYNNWVLSFNMYKNTYTFCMSDFIEIHLASERKYWYTYVVHDNWFDIRKLHVGSCEGRITGTIIGLGSASVKNWINNINDFKKMLIYFSFKIFQYRFADRLKILFFMIVELASATVDKLVSCFE